MKTVMWKKTAQRCDKPPRALRIGLYEEPSVFCPLTCPRHSGRPLLQDEHPPTFNGTGMIRLRPPQIDRIACASHMESLYITPHSLLWAIQIHSARGLRSKPRSAVTRGCWDERLCPHYNKQDASCGKTEMMWYCCACPWFTSAVVYLYNISML